MVLFFLLREDTLPIIGEETGVGIACRVLGCGEGSQQIKVTVMVEIITIDDVIHCYILIEGSDIELFGRAIVDSRV